MRLERERDERNGEEYRRRGANEESNSDEDDDYIDADVNDGNNNINLAATTET